MYHPAMREVQGWADLEKENTFDMLALSGGRG